jgi:hypothetical protein
MAKGAVLIGCGCVPTQADVQGAAKAGHIKNFDVVSTTGLPSTIEVDEQIAYATYISMARDKGWDTEGDLQAIRLTTSDGRRMWAVSRAQSRDDRFREAGIERVTIDFSQFPTSTPKRWWQFWK